MDFSVENSPLTVFPAFVASPIRDSALLFFNTIKLLLKAIINLIRDSEETAAGEESEETEDAVENEDEE